MPAHLRATLEIDARRGGEAELVIGTYMAWASAMSLRRASIGRDIMWSACIGDATYIIARAVTAALKSWCVRRSPDCAGLRRCRALRIYSAWRRCARVMVSTVIHGRGGPL